MLRRLPKRSARNWERSGRYLIRFMDKDRPQKHGRLSYLANWIATTESLPHLLLDLMFHDFAASGYVGLRVFIQRSIPEFEE
jgi:hypothetical protein